MRLEQPGVDSFTQLSDVPHSYVGEGSKALTVAVTEDGIVFTTGGGGAVWGGITGTLSDQTDLQAALDSKLDDTQFSGLAKISVGAIAPVAPATGDLWVDTN